MLGDQKILRLPKGMLRYISSMAFCGPYFSLDSGIAFKRLSKDTPHEPAVCHGTHLPQEIWNQIIEEYHTSYPDQPLYHLLLTSRSLYEATITSLYRSVVFNITQEGRDKWPLLLTSLSKYASWVRKLDITELRGPEEQTELGGGEFAPTFLDYLANLSQLRALSIKCHGAKLPVPILVTASRLPHLKTLELTNLSFVEGPCPCPPFPPMESLREIRLTNIREHDGSLKWSTFLPCTLNRSLRHFEYCRLPKSGNEQDNYSFLRPLEEDPELSFSDMRELRLPRPITEEDTNRAIDLLQRCPSLLALGFEANGFKGTWGNQINELGARLPWGHLNDLRAINGPPGLISAIAPGRPIQKAMVRLERPTEFPLLGTLEALQRSSCPIEVLAIWTNNWRETTLQEIVQLFPQLKNLAICVLSVPALVGLQVLLLAGRSLD